MKKSISKLIIFLSLSIAGMISDPALPYGGVGSLSDSDAKESFTAFADVELSNIHDDLRVWSYVTTELANTPQTNVLRRMIAQSIYRKVGMVKTLNPDIKKLKGDGLETLCLLTQPSAQSIWDSVDAGSHGPPMSKLATDYLKSVEPTVKVEIARLQKAMKGTGCHL